jgi:regulator of cell morphogenesis and NO signaling
MINGADTPLNAKMHSPNSATFLGRYDIETTLNSVPLEELAVEKGVNADFLIQLINSSYDPSSASVADFDGYPIPTLVDYLERSHRYYLQKTLPEIEQSILALELGNRHNRLYALISRFFTDYRNALEEHFSYEEQRLFPYAKLLFRSKERWYLMPSLHVFLGQYSTAEFIANHSHKNETELRQVKTAFMNYEPPKENILPYHILLSQLKNFEEDLHIHALIEDKVLIPKMQSIESLLNG